MSAEADLDRVIPESAVLSAADDLLRAANWRLEFEGIGTLQIPREPRPIVASRAYVKAHAPNIILGDHYEAVVYLGPETTSGNWFAKFGALRMYFNREGQFVTEDRYPPIASV